MPGVGARWMSVGRAGVPGAATAVAAAGDGAAAGALAPVGAAFGWKTKNTTDRPTTSTVMQPSAPQNQPGNSLDRAP